MIAGGRACRREGMAVDPPSRSTAKDALGHAAGGTAYDVILLDSDLTKDPRRTMVRRALVLRADARFAQCSC